MLKTIILSYFYGSLYVAYAAETFMSKPRLFRAVLPKDHQSFVKVKNLTNIVSSVECAAHLLLDWQLNTPKSRAQAYQYEKGNKLCHIGMVGQLAGDYDDQSTINNTAGAVHVIYGCLPKVSVLRDDIFFYMSFLDDNPEFHAHLKPPGQALQRIYQTSSFFDVEPYHLDTLATVPNVVTDIPFSLPFNSLYPGMLRGEDPRNAGWVLYSTPPTAVSSFSIFAWHYNYRDSHFNNILAYGIGEDSYKSPELSFNLGYTHVSTAGQLSAVVKPNGVVSVKFTTSPLPSLSLWTFVGVVFDTTTGIFTFYKNGVIVENSVGATATNIPLTNLDTIFVGKTKNGVGAWTARSSTEMYLSPVTQAKAAAIYEEALNSRAGTAC